MSAPHVVLASTSKYRRALFSRLGVPFDVEPSHVDEEAYKAQGHAPLALSRILAEAKARAVRDRLPGCLVIGSDQVADLDGRVLDKPGSRENARAQLARLSGRTHALHTAVSILGVDGSLTTDVVTVRLTMRSLGADAIDRYLDADEPYDCCGSYRIESRGIALFDSIDASDATAIEGLPMLTVVRRLSRAGFAIP